MLAKITLYDGTVYKIASQTVDTEDGIYLGRIKDELSLVSAMQEAGNAPETISLTIINYDNFIPHNKDLWAADVLLTNDNNISWRGKINFCNFDSDGNLYVTASEKTAPELELQLPDEVRQVYTVDEDFHQSSVTMTIPLVIGGTTSNPITLPTILIDKTRGIYLICVGEIRSVVKVYNGAEELPQAAYTAYTGTANQQENAGFAYVQIAEDYRLNSDGTYAEINVDIVGLKLGNHTEAECRNGARFLYYFLTTADTGINGWGCGIDSSLIDITSFNSAITLCDQLGYKLDGIMWLRQSAQSWIDQICQAIHGKYSINANGKRSLFIDYAGNASKKTFTASNMQVERYGKNSYTSVVYNKGVLSYDYNPITGLFMQSAQYENSDSIAQIGEQKFIGESYLIKDATTALAVLEYTCKRSQIAAEAIEFDTDAVETNLRAGDIITINRPDLNLNNALYQIQSISTTDFQSSIIAVKFDTSIFNVTGTASTVNWGNERDITPALTPAMATSLNLSTGFDINPDGTGTPYISGTFTVPDGGWLAAAVQYGIGADPTNWTELSLITEGSFKIAPVNVGTVYAIRVRMITATGHSDYLKNVITSTGDTTPPGKPTISAKATDKTVTIQCGLDTPPADMGGFQIYRKKSTDSESAYTYIGSIAANRGYAAFSDYVDEYVTYNYKAKSYDRSGNLSTQFSDVANVAITGIEAVELAASAIAMPTGSILRLSAKNCTTASIAVDNGVKDLSGWGHHGRAYGGVTVLDGGEGFSFDGTGRINFSQKDYLSGLTKLSISARFLITEKDDNTRYITLLGTGTGVDSFNQLALRIERTSAGGLFSFGGRGVSTDPIALAKAEVSENVEYHAVGTVDFITKEIILYLNGVRVATETLASTGSLVTPNIFNIGANRSNSNGWKGYIKDLRIYPFILTPTQVKSIYMLPDEAVFAQLTTDMFGANIIHANYILNDGDFQTLAVNAVNANINNLNVVGNATFQSTLSEAIDNIDVGTRNLAKSTSETEIEMKSDGTSSVGTYKLYPLSIALEQGKSYTISFYAKCSNTTDIFYCSLAQGNSTKQYFFTGKTLTTSYKKYSFTITKGSASVNNLLITNYYNYGGQSANTGTLYFKDVKLEEGNKSTSWTPAPEDVDSNINTVQSNLDTVTTNIYSPNTTTINGGKITTGTITASQISVSARKPIGCIVEYCTNYLPINSTSKTYSVADLSGNALAGSYTGAIYDLRNTLLGHAMRSSTEFSTGVFSNSTDFTLSLWLKNNDTSNHGSFYGHFYNGSTQKGFLWAGGSVQHINLSLETGGEKKGVFPNAQDGNVHHYVLTRSGTTIKSYKDGVLSNTITATANGAINKITIGNSYINTNNIAIWNRALTADEVMALYKAGTDTESGQITADRIATDAIKSRNYAYSSGLYSTAGTFLDLANGQIISKNFSIDSSGNASFKGNVQANSGTIGNFSISNGALMGVSSNTTYSFMVLDFTASTYQYTTNINCGNINFQYNIISGNTKWTSKYTLLSTDYLMFDSYSSSGVAYTRNTIKSNEIRLNRLDSYKNEAVLSGESVSMLTLTEKSGGATSYSSAVLRVYPNATTQYGLYVAGKARINATDYTSDEATKKDFQDVSTLDKLKALRVCAWRFDEEKLVEKDNAFIDSENIKIEAENKAIDAENAEIEKENEKRKNRKDGGEVELLPLKERKKLIEHRIADKNANHPLNIGCMAGEFNKAFGTNNGSEDSLSVTDTIGVCMKAIQELAEIVDSQKAEIAELKALLKNQQDTKSELTDHFNDLVKEPTNEKELIEPSFDELLKDEENQQEEQKQDEK